jgi:antitoxin HicB
MSDELTYTVFLLPEPEGGFTVQVPALPEVVTHGIDEADAMRMAREAIEAVLEVYREDGNDWPKDVVAFTRKVTVSFAT